MDIKNKIEEILLTDYQYFDFYTVDKLLALFTVGGRSYHEGTKCQCKPDDTTGETSVMCCNNCGKPAEDFWVKK